MAGLDAILLKDRESIPSVVLEEQPSWVTVSISAPLLRASKRAMCITYPSDSLHLRVDVDIVARVIRA